MAEILLGGIGAAIAGIPDLGITALTGFQIGATLGALLFPQTGPPIDRGKLDEIRVQNATQGTPIAILYGRNRIAGTVIWATGVQENKNTHSEGGKGGGGVSVTDYTYSTSLAVLVCEAAPSGHTTTVRRIWANDQVVWDNRGSSLSVPSWIDSTKVRIYNGTQTLPDSAIEADKGVGNVPAFMGMCYIVFENLQLANVNNSIPNITVEVETSMTVADALADVCTRTNIPSGYYDFSSVSSLSASGLIVNSRTEGNRVMDTLSQAFWFDMVETSGKLRSVPRTGTSVYTIPATDIGANADNGEIKPYVETTRLQEVDLPGVVQVNYTSEAQDFQQFSQTAKRTTRYSQNQDSVSFPMSLSDAYAKYVADSRLMAAWTERETHTLSLPYRYLFLDPGDVVTVPLEGGRVKTLRVTSMNAGMLAQIEVKAVTDNSITYVDPHLPAASSPTSPTGSVVGSGTPAFVVGEINAPSDATADTCNLFFSAAVATPGWRGGVVQADVNMRSSGGGWITGGNTLATFSSSSNMGFTDSGALGTLPAGALGVIDRVNTLRVNMTSGSLTSVTESDLILFGKNLCLVGEEIIQFTTATPVLSGVYDLTGLIRGLRGTDYFINSHASGEPFTMLDNSGVNFAYNPTMKGVVSDFRLLETGNSYSGGLPAYSHSTTLKCSSRLPYPPCSLKASGDRSGGSNDVTLSWVRRARKTAELADYSDVPLDETAEQYELEIWNAAGTVLLRTVTGITSPSLVYTAATQATDGVGSASFQFRVFQITPYAGIGRGRPSPLCLVPLRPLY